MKSFRQRATTTMRVSVINWLPNILLFFSFFIAQIEIIFLLCQRGPTTDSWRIDSTITYKTKRWKVEIRAQNFHHERKPPPSISRASGTTPRGQGAGTWCEARNKLIQQIQWELSKWHDAWNRTSTDHSTPDAGSRCKRSRKESEVGRGEGGSWKNEWRLAMNARSGLLALEVLREVNSTSRVYPELVVLSAESNIGIRCHSTE